MYSPETSANVIHYLLLLPFASQIVVVFVNRELSDRSVNWPRVRRRNLPQYLVITQFEILLGVVIHKCQIKLKAIVYFFEVRNISI